MNEKRPPDFWLFVIVMALLVVGLFMVFDSSYARAGQAAYTGGDSRFFLKRQAVFAAVGLLLMAGIMRVRYWHLKAIAPAALVISIVGLALVLVPGVGDKVNGARRSMDIPGVPFLSIQPSEVAKLGLILYLAAAFAAKKREVRDFKLGIVPAVFVLGIMGGLVMLEPDMGTTIVLAITVMVMLFLAGARAWHLAGLAAAGVVLGSILIFTSQYRTERVMSFIDPFKDERGDSYQICQSLIGLGSGGVLGTGLCESRQKLFFLPEPHTDFILTVLGQEVGLVGTAGVIVLFLLLAYRGLMIAARTREGFGKLLAGGITGMICLQALMNMAVVTSSIPATGVPLPFISYGGSSLTMNLMCIGILLSISQYPAPVESYEHESRIYRRRDRRTRVSGSRRR